MTAAGVSMTRQIVSGIGWNNRAGTSDGPGPGSVPELIVLKPMRAALPSAGTVTPVTARPARQPVPEMPQTSARIAAGEIVEIWSERRGRRERRDVKPLQRGGRLTVGRG